MIQLQQRPPAPLARKRYRALETLSLIFTNIRNAFEHSVLPIQKLAFIIGSSLVTPKDTFVLTYPTNHIEGEFQ